MQVSKFLQDDLAYELQVRGIALGTAAEMKHSLAMRVHPEISNQVILSQFNGCSSSFMNLQFMLAYVSNSRC